MPGIYFAFLSPSYAPERPEPKMPDHMRLPICLCSSSSCSRSLPILEREFNRALTLLSLRPLSNPLLKPKTLIPLIPSPATMFLPEHHMLRPNSAFLSIAFIAFPLYLQAFLNVLALFDAGFIGVDVFLSVAKSLVVPIVELHG